jgi:hypothetical protein
LFPIPEELFMIDPRSSRLLPVSTGATTQKNLPTGNNFSGSSLSSIQPETSVFSIVTDSVSISDRTTIPPIPQSRGYCEGKRDLITNEQQSPLVVEAGKILVVAIWFWCLIGANFCFDSLSTIVRYCLQDI